MDTLALSSSAGVSGLRLPGSRQIYLMPCVLRSSSCSPLGLCPAALPNPILDAISLKGMAEPIELDCPTGRPPQLLGCLTCLDQLHPAFLGVHGP